VRVVRWLLVVPLAIAVWYVVFFAGIVTHENVEARLCPPQDWVSGSCVNAGVDTVLTILIHVFIGLSAIAVEVVAVATAPSHRHIVAWATFGLGTLCAVWMGVETRSYSEMATALLAGLLAAVMSVRFTRA